MAARRCSTCGINWPTIGGKPECRACGGETSWINEAMPHSKEEAFEAIYAQRGEQPLPKEHRKVVERLSRHVDEIIALEAIPVDGDEIPVERIPPEHFGKDRHLLHRYD